MPKKRPFRVSRDQSGGITPGSYGRRSNVGGVSFNAAAWTGGMSAAQSGAKEVMVKITGGGRDADGVQAHMEYIDRHGKLPLETDRGEVLAGKDAAGMAIEDWALDYGRAPGERHSTRKRVAGDEKKRGREGPRQAFNIMLSMPAGTPPGKVLAAVKKFAREEFGNQHRYLMALHAEEKADGHGAHPHVHLVVKAEHEYGGVRLNPRKADLRRWREQFALYLNEQGVVATATRREDRGKAKTDKRTPIYRAMARGQGRARAGADSLLAEAGESVFMRQKLADIRRELGSTGTVEDRQAYRALLAVRGQVAQRYQAAIDWLRRSGREEEARRFELMQGALPPVQTEKQLIAGGAAG